MCWWGHEALGPHMGDGEGMSSMTASWRCNSITHNAIGDNFSGSMGWHQAQAHLGLSPEETFHLRSNSAATVGSDDILAGQLPLHQPAFGDGIWSRTMCISQSF